MMRKRKELIVKNLNYQQQPYNLLIFNTATQI